MNNWSNGERSRTRRGIATKTFLLVGHVGFHNRGCEAIVRTTTGLLSTRFPNSLIVLSSSHPDQDRASEVSRGLRVVPASTPSLSLPRLAERLARMVRFPHAWPYYLAPLRGVVRTADAVLAIGGDNYTQEYGFPTYHVGVARMVHSLRRPLVIWGASVGPFTHAHIRDAVLEIMRGAALITARESLTRDYLAANGVVDNVRLVADPAFLLEPEACELPSLCREEGPVLGINVSPLIARFAEDGGSTLRRALVRLIREAVDMYGLYVLFIPHVTSPAGTASPRADDYLFMKAILDDVARPGKVALLPPRLDAAQTKFVISQCAFFIGARTHSTIAAMSSGVPTISLAYNQKALGINRDIFGHLRWVVDIRELRHDDQLMLTFQDLLSERGRVSAHLQETIPVMKERARAGVDYLAEALDEGGLGE